jgi:hypothetical protein
VRFPPPVLLGGAPTSWHSCPRWGGVLRNGRDVLRVFYLHAVDILSALFTTDDLVCGVGGEKTRSLRWSWFGRSKREITDAETFSSTRGKCRCTAHPDTRCLVFGVFFFYHDAMNCMARLAHSCSSPDLGREGGGIILGFFYEPRGPVSYRMQFFFWEDLQNAFFSRAAHVAVAAARARGGCLMGG